MLDGNSLTYLSVFCGYSNQIKSINLFVYLLLFPIILPAQNQNTYNLSFANAPLLDVLETLENDYDITFAYSSDWLEGVSITQTVSANSLEQAMKYLFHETDILYECKENTVLLRPNFSKTSPPPTQPLSYHIKGHITDKQTGEPLPYANLICLENQNLGTTTNENGYFEWELPTNAPVTVIVQYIGYDQQRLKIEPNTKQKNIQLQAKIHQLKSITITEQLPIIKQDNQTQATSINASQLSRLPSFIGGPDIMRAVQMLPGVQADDDLSAELRVRGSDAGENLVVLDGITLYNVDHYFGVFSLVNPSIIQQATLYKNNLPTTYSDRTASVLDISTKAPEEALSFGGQVDANLLTTSAYVEMPIGKNIGVLLAGRTTNQNLAGTSLFNLLEQRTRTQARVIENLLFDKPQEFFSTYEPNFTFYDVNAKLNWIWTEQTNLSASYFRGTDAFAFDYDRIFNNQQRGYAIDNTETYEEKSNWLNQGFGIQLNHQWSEQLQSNILVSRSNYAYVSNLDAGLYRAIDFQPNFLEDFEQDIQFSNYSSNAITGTEANWSNQWIIDKQQMLQFGYHFIHNSLYFDIKSDNIELLSQEKEAIQQAIYGEYQYQNDNGLAATVGLRSTHFNTTNKVYFSPRLSLTYQVNEQWSIKSAWNRNNQFLRQLYHEDRFGRSFDYWVLADKDKFEISTASQFMLGSNWKTDGWEVDVELYHKNTQGILEYALLYNGFNEDRIGPAVDLNYSIFRGERLTKGIDVLLKKGIGDYTGWIAYTLSKTEDKFPNINKGDYFPAQNDRRHQLKWINQYRWKKFDFSASYIFSSGKPYTNFTNLEYEADRRDTNPEDRLSYLPNYHRFDIGLNYQFEWKGLSIDVGASVLNLFDTKNVKYKQYIYAFPNEENKRSKTSIIGTELQLLGRTPNLSISIGF